MNICIVSISPMGPNKGGVESVCYNLAQEIQRRGGHRISHLYASNSGTAKIECEASAQLPELHEQDAVERIRAFLHEQGVDIVWNHAPTPELNPILRAATDGSNTKIVSIYHSSPYTRFNELRERYALALYRARYKGEWLTLCKHLIKFPRSWINTGRKTQQDLRSLADFSDLVCPLSELYVPEFMRLSGRKYSNFCAVTNPLLPAAKPSSPKEKKNQLLVVARHAWKHKRIDRIIRIWHKIEAKYKDWQLVILGDGPDHDDFVEVAQRLGVQNIVFTGTRPPESYYSESKIICMTSGWEGLPMALLEAQQYGCVPIAYESFSALPDIIENGKTGFRIPAFNEQKFIEKLSYLMTHEGERERMAENCIQHANKFQVSDIVNRWLSIFSDLLSR